MIIVKFSEIDMFLGECFKDYKLCFLDRIQETIVDWDEASKIYLSQPGKDADREERLYSYGYRDPHLNMKEYPNPEYDLKTSRFIAYFTPLDLKDQWGDDWDDIPYEINAGIPEENENYEIIGITFGPENSTAWIKLPDSYSFGGESPWSVKDINQGAVAWLYASGCYEGVSLNAGITIEEFKNKINKIKTLL